MSDKITIKTVDNNATVNIVVSGHFMQRLQDVYIEYISKIGVDKTNEIYPHMKDDSLKDIQDPQLKADAYNIETLVILLKEIETAFGKADLIDDTEVDIPNED